MPKECAPESEKSEAAFWTLFGLWGALFGDSGAPGVEGLGEPFGLVLDSFGVPGPKGPGDPFARPGGCPTPSP